VPHLGPGGRIITIGSNAAIRTAFPGFSVYSMTKGALISLVRAVAIDLGPRGITVNNVQPGSTATDMSAGVPGLVEALTPLTPLARIAQPEEIAGMVAYLASPEAGFVTGASLTIDGGYVA
jgi:3-oxoacyl-[acyl-carrier protein] reductase